MMALSDTYKQKKNDLFCTYIDYTLLSKLTLLVFVDLSVNLWGYWEICFTFPIPLEGDLTLVWATLATLRSASESQKMGSGWMPLSRIWLSSEHRKPRGLEQTCSHVIWSTFLTTTAGVVIVIPWAALRIHVLILSHAQYDEMFTVHFEQLRTGKAKDITKEDHSRMWTPMPDCTHSSMTAWLPEEASPALLPQALVHF